MTFEELQIEELKHIISDLKQQLNYELRKNRILNNQIDNLQRNVGYLCEENIKLRDTINEHEYLF